MTDPASGAIDDFMALVTSEEPLHPDLEPYVEEHPRIGSVLRHPLVYMVAGVRPGLANAMYAQKRESLARAHTEQHWRTVVFLHERPWRLDALVELDADGRLPDEDYWSLVGDVWIDSENIWQNLSAWREVLSDDRPAREFLMDPADRGEFGRLPDTLTVYRGAGRGINEQGLSWTLERGRAHWFARRRRRPGEEPVVLRGTVSKANALAVFHGRNEHEIVVADPAVVRIESTEPGVRSLEQDEG